MYMRTVAPEPAARESEDNLPIFHEEPIPWFFDTDPSTGSRYQKHGRGNLIALHDLSRVLCRCRRHGGEQGLGLRFIDPFVVVSTENFSVGAQWSLTMLSTVTKGLPGALCAARI